MQKLKAQLLEHENQGAGGIKVFYIAEHQNPLFIELFEIKEAAFQNHLCKLFKLSAEQAHPQIDIIFSKVCKQLTLLKDWSAILSCLQAFNYLNNWTPHIEILDHFIHQHLNHPNKLVKTWALQAFYKLSQHIKSYKESFLLTLEQYEATAEGALAARIRHIRKDIKKNQSKK